MYYLKIIDYMKLFLFYFILNSNDSDFVFKYIYYILY